MGLPGSGKGTQADLVSERFGFFHFDTGRVLEKEWYDPAKQNDPVVVRERKNFESGVLNSPDVVNTVVERYIKQYSAEGKNLVFSGSPRSIVQAEFLFKVFESLFGYENVLVFAVDVSEDTSLFRNSNRRVCKKCRTPVLWNSETKDWRVCPKCGGELVKRSLDVPEIIKERFREYYRQTEPVFELIKKVGIETVHVNGELPPEAIAEEVRNHLESWSKKHTT